MSALKSNKKEPKPKKEKAPKAKKVKSTAQNQPVAFKAPKVKVRADIYTLVLLLAWLALTAACVLLYMDIKSYSM